MKVVAVIPCYDEETMIADIVKRASGVVDGVIVVDNGSKNGTANIARKVGAMVVECGEHGAGAATEFGMNTALETEHHNIIVTLDGDGQHNADEIPKLVKPIKNGKADLVIGSRFLGEYKLPKYRKFGIDVITWLYNFGYKQKITDGQSCFRAYSREALKVIMPIEERGFAFSVETLIKARVNGLRIVEVPISCIYHNRRQDSTLNPIGHGLSVAFGVVKWRMKSALLHRENKPRN